MKNNWGFAIDGVFFAQRFPEDIKLFRIPDPPRNQYMIMGWRRDRCPPHVREFLDSIPKVV